MSSVNPLVSIVLPTYNGKRYLEESVQSVIDQTYDNWELIIVDDASTDDTPALIEKLVQRDDRITSIRHAQNRKLPGALNTGFAAARGHYFTWTSDDNLYRAHALAVMVQELENNPQIGLVYSDYSFIDDGGHVTGRAVVAPPNMLVRKATVDACFLYRRVVHETLNGYDETLFLIEDYDFWLRASMHFTFLPIHEDLYQYRYHDTSLTTTRHQQVMQLREEMLMKHVPYLGWASSTDLARGYLHISDLAAQHGRWQRALKYAGRSLIVSPAVFIRHYVRKILPESLEKRATELYKSLVMRARGKFQN